MEQKIKTLLEQLERMREQSKRNVDDGDALYFMHARCALEFAELAIEVFAEMQHELPQFGEGFMARLSLYSEKRAQKLFQEGWFNSIAIGYGKIALERMGITLFSQFESEMNKAFDLYDSEQATAIYRRIEKGDE